MKEIPHLQEAFAQVLQEARAHSRLSQQALANEVECARSFISFMETRDHLPSLNGFLVLARALGVSSTELLARVEAKLATLEYLDKKE
nr:helix-turn-helix transcriptional regulator [Desulfovibrio litoralis]